MKDTDNKISYFELFRKMEQNGMQTKEPLIYGILRRITKYEEVWYNSRIDFDTFLTLLKRAMNLSNSRQQAKIIFDIFDLDKTGFISAHNITHVTRRLGNELSMDEVNSIIAKCSSNHSLISLEDFMQVMAPTDAMFGHLELFEQAPDKNNKD